MKTMGELHGTAVLISPDGSEHVVDNVQQFVEDNYELFESDEDVKHRKCPEHEDGRRNNEYWTRADRSLRQVIRGELEEWKGWKLK